MKRCAFTLLELLVVLAILSLLVFLISPAVIQEVRKARGRACHGNLLMIENAKEQFRHELPGQSLTSLDQLAPYLPEGRLPHCPSGGSYAQVLRLDAQAQCSFNGSEGEPAGTEAPLDNGYHDIPAGN